jgi:peroxiredoxin
VETVAVGLVVAWGLLGLGGWLGYQLLLRHGRLLLRLEALERRLGLPGVPDGEGDLSLGLPAGSVVHDFDLPALAGGRMTLSRWRGRRVLLIFFDPRCGFCRQLLPDLAALPGDGADGRPLPLILTTGDAAENRRLVAAQGIRCPVLLQEDREVASLYQVGGTPMGYLIDEQGRTASALAAGAAALLALAGAAPAGAAARPGPGAAGAGDGSVRDLVTRAPVKSRIERDGLPPGTPAPGFRLPLLDGGERSLESFRGRRVLLVFSDPACGPCDRLLPALERLHRRAQASRVLLVSRGDAEANRAKVAEHGLTLPIVLQRHWEISRAYAMFATPVGYLIDEGGVITADVAVGAEAILALASARAVRDERETSGVPPQR